MAVLVTDIACEISTISSVATRRKPRGPLFLAEWFANRGLDDATIAERIGVARESVWRWRIGDRIPRPSMLRQLAKMLGIEPEQFYRRPGRPSLDAMAKDTSDEEYAKIVNIVALLTSRSGNTS